MIVNDWLEELRSKSTKNVYRCGIRAFAKVVNGDTDFDRSLEAYTTQVKEEERNPFEDLLKFAISLTEKNTPPKTANVYKSAVVSFLEYAIDFELTRKQEKQLRNKMPRGKRARTIEEDLTLPRLRKILSHCDTKGKALFLFLESSGIRIGEALQLEFSDLDLESTPAKVSVRGEYTKNGDQYYSFISKEAEEALDEWLKVRGDYLQSSLKRGAGLAKTGYGRGVKSAKDDRIFPFSVSVPNLMWNNALRKAGLENHDKGTGRRTLHIHMLRKVFSSRMKLVVPREIVEALMGHEGYLDDAYRRYTKEEIKEWYRKGESHLYVFVPQELRKIQTHINAELEELTKRVKESDHNNLTLLIQNNKLSGEITELKERVVTMYDKFEGRVESLANELFERWKKETRDLIHEEQQALRDEEKERERAQAKLRENPIPKGELASLHKRAEKETK